MNPLDLSPDELRTEYSKLRVELDEISQQKDQAAQYGLQLIEDQSVLKDEFTQLQELFEATKHERDCAKEALGQIQLNMKTQTAVGVSFEDALLKVRWILISFTYCRWSIARGRSVEGEVDFALIYILQLADD